MPIGTVKLWNEDRGFGFVTPDGGTERDVFERRVTRVGLHRFQCRELIISACSNELPFLGNCIP